MTTKNIFIPREFSHTPSDKEKTKSRRRNLTDYTESLRRLSMFMNLVNSKRKAQIHYSKIFSFVKIHWNFIETHYTAIKILRGVLCTWDINDKIRHRDWLLGWFHKFVFYLELQKHLFVLCHKRAILENLKFLESLVLTVWKS